MARSRTDLSALGREIEAFWRRSRPVVVAELESTGRLYDVLWEVQQRAHETRDGFLAGGWPSRAAWDLTALEHELLPKMPEPVAPDPTFLRELVRGPLRFSAGELRIVLFVATAAWPPTAREVAVDLGLDYRNGKHLVAGLVKAGVLERTEAGLRIVTDSTGWHAAPTPRKGWRADLGRRLTRALTGTPEERALEVAALAAPERRDQLRRLVGKG